MTAVDPDLRATRTTCAYCGVGCGVLATPDGRGGAAISGDPDASRQFRPAVFEGIGARRDARPDRSAALSDDPLRQGGHGAGGLERCARSCRASLPAHHRARRSGRGRVLSLRPVADRGLLRRQQADEGLHRQRQCRHQFAAVHGFVGRRPPPRLRCRHGARLLRRSRRGRSAGAGRLQRGLVPSGAVPAHAGQQAAARCAHRRDRSAPHRHRRRRRPVPRPEARHRYARCSAGCWFISPTTVRLDRDYIERYTSGFDEAIARARSMAGSAAATALATGLSERTSRRFSGCSPTPTRRHHVLAGRQPVGAGHRQGQRHPQLPSRHRADRQGRASGRSR